jgi:hypothetical protein
MDAYTELPSLNQVAKKYNYSKIGSENGSADTITMVFPLH